MKDLSAIQTVYLLGIGGIGMSALARYFSFHGRKVSGYDRSETLLTKKLVEEGIPVHYHESIDLIPKDADIIIYTPAIPVSNKEFVYLKDHGYSVIKRSEALGIITERSFNICIAGTHGKTTISSMVAHILRDSGYGCNAFLGGIAANYQTNFWSNENNVCVVEADEYDRSFLKLHPNIALISAMDADHLDIYGSETAMQEAFIEFTGKIKKGGCLLYKLGLKRADEFKSERSYSYSASDALANAHVKNIELNEGAYSFSVAFADRLISDLTLNMGGMHNVENMVAAVAIATSLGIADDKIRKAVSTFKGVKRRFEFIYRGTSGGKRIVYIDDYAHHPEELRSLITGARSLFPDMHCLVIFQPHLFSRTKDLAEDFARVLSMADEVFLLPIYPAREVPVAGVTSTLIGDRIAGQNARILEKPELVGALKEYIGHAIGREKDILLVTAGAGDIDALVLPVKEMLESLNYN